MSHTNCLQCSDIGIVICSSCEGKGEYGGFLGYHTHECHCRGRGKELCPSCEGGKNKFELLRQLYSTQGTTASAALPGPKLPEPPSKSHIRLQALVGFLSTSILTVFCTLIAVSIGVMHFPKPFKTLLGYISLVTVLPMTWFLFQMITGLSTRSIRKKWPSLTPFRLYLYTFFGVVILATAFFGLWAAWLWLTTDFTSV